MSLDTLLQYAAMKGSGSYADWQAASRSSGVHSPFRSLLNLSILGHVDLALRPRDSPQWSCSTPVLARLPSPSPMGVLCGARTPGLRDAIPGTLTLEILPQEGGPEVWRCSAGEFSQLEASARAAHITFPQTPPALSLSRALPTLAENLSIVGRPIARPQSPESPQAWDPVSTAWADRAFSPVPGSLWRFRDRYSGRWVGAWFSRDRKLVEMDDLGPAQLIMAGRSGIDVFRYDDRAARFHVRSGYSLPRLHARALCLSSGFLPSTDSTGGKSFSDVPAGIARNVQLRLSLGSEQ